ncbi:hypothetical protein L2E82_48085 [Cichorium intybus]|uniref:Uncharacterized protein n=1 Tax=Cichorium intybus TaxID=13427 RepID=A0ACB8YXB6_CICIN|nr:hypothetical protein L2E82_48085 [Cichorium intybus]
MPATVATLVSLKENCSNPIVSKKLPKGHPKSLPPAVPLLSDSSLFLITQKARLALLAVSSSGMSSWSNGLLNPIAIRGSIHEKVKRLKILLVVEGIHNTNV